MNSLELNKVIREQRSELFGPESQFTNATFTIELNKKSGELSDEEREFLKDVTEGTNWSFIRCIFDGNRNKTFAYYEY